MNKYKRRGARGAQRAESGGRQARRKEGDGVEGRSRQTRSPAGGIGRKKGKRKMERSVRVCVRWRRRRGRGKGCQAGSRAAAAGRSPGQRAVRARPGGGTLRSHREGRAAAAGRHTPARRARLSGGGAGCARLRRRPGPWAPRPASLQVTLAAFGGAGGGNCRRGAPCGLRGGGGGASRLWSQAVGGPPVSPASSVLSSRVSPGNLGGVPGAVGAGRYAEKGGIWSHGAASPAGVLELGERPRSSGGDVLLRKPPRKVWLPRVFGRVPHPSSGGVRLRRRWEATPGRGLSPGDPSRVPSSAGSGCTGARGEQRLRTSQPGGAGMPRPAGLCQPSCEARGREGKRPLADEPLQLPNGPMSSLRSPSGSQTEPPSCGAESAGGSSQKCPCDSDRFHPKPGNL